MRNITCPGRNTILKVKQAFNLLNNSLPDSATLKFTPKDIRYIIVRRESEILEMMDSLEKIKSPKFPPHEVRKLQTRILSAEQIREDF